VYCENEYCVYNRTLKCTLENININSLGMCDDCIMVELDKGFLEAEKRKQRHGIENRANTVRPYDNM